MAGEWDGRCPSYEYHLEHCVKAGTEAEPADVRAEIVRLSVRLPADDPLRIAIACAPVETPRQ